jgi:hypothetical protein
MGAAPRQPIITIFGRFSRLADVIKCTKFQNDRSRVPENGMFPYESEVVLNIVLSANALAHDGAYHGIMLSFVHENVLCISTFCSYIDFQLNFSVLIEILLK